MISSTDLQAQPHPYSSVEDNWAHIFPSKSDHARKKLTSRPPSPNCGRGCELYPTLPLNIEGRIQASNSNPPLNHRRGGFDSRLTLYCRGKGRMKANSSAHTLLYSEGYEPVPGRVGPAPFRVKFKEWWPRGFLGLQKLYWTQEAIRISTQLDHKVSLHKRSKHNPFLGPNLN